MYIRRMRMIFQTFRRHLRAFPMLSTLSRLPKIPLVASAAILGGYAMWSNSICLHLEDIKDDLTPSTPVLTPVTKANFNAIMNNQKDKLIYFSDTKLEGPAKEYIEKIIGEIQKTYHLDTYYVDLNELKPEMKKHLSTKGVKIDLEEALGKYNFILMNKYTDYWFWTFDLLGAYLAEEVSLELLRYFRGVKAIKDLDGIIERTKRDGAVHLVAYVDHPMDMKNHEKHKMLRKLNTKYSDENQQAFCWIITDSEIAKKLGLSTDEKDMGDIYLLKILPKRSSQNIPGKIVDVNGYTFSTEKLFTQKEALRNQFSSFKKVATLVHERPIVCTDEFQYIRFRGRHGDCNVLLVLADEEKDNLPEVYNTLQELRKAIPWKEPEDENSVEEHLKNHTNTVFLLCTKRSLPKLYPTAGDKLVVKYEKKGSIDLIKEYLPKLRKIEGLGTDEFIKRTKATPTIEKPGASIKENESAKARQMLFASDRFKLKKTYQMDAEFSVTNLLEFIQKCNKDQAPVYLSSHPIKKKAAVKIVGDDFENLVYKNPKNVVVLLEPKQKDVHPEIRAAFEDICTENGKSIMFGRYNVINESPVFRYEGPTPAVVVFPKEVKEKPIYFNLSEYLRQGTKLNEVIERLKEFIKVNTQG